MPQAPRLLDEVRKAIRLRHYSYRTEKAYVDWIWRFVVYHDKRHPVQMGGSEVEGFLSHLARDRDVSAATQGQALAAILLQGTYWLIGVLFYGSGLRLTEALRLRVKDLELENHRILVRDGKGSKDRVTILPSSLVPHLRAHLEKVRELHRQAIKLGFGGVELPSALERKYPRAHLEWGWQYVFPAARPSIDPRTNARRRHHIFEDTVQRHVRNAARAAGIEKAGVIPHVSPQLRDASAGKRL
jgi:integrase